MRHISCRSLGVSRLIMMRVGYVWTADIPVVITLRNRDGTLTIFLTSYFLKFHFLQALAAQGWKSRGSVCGSQGTNTSIVHPQPSPPLPPLLPSACHYKSKSKILASIEWLNNLHFKIGDFVSFDIQKDYFQFIYSNYHRHEGKVLNVRRCLSIQAQGLKTVV